MEPEVHIIDKYFQEILHCFTMTNIQCKGRKEIDLLAINALENKRYHVEARISRSFPLRLRETKTKSGKSHKNGVDYFAEEKFNHPYVLEKIRQFFGNKNYERILVVYRVHGEDLVKEELLERNQSDEIIESAHKKFGIRIWYITRLISELKYDGSMKGSRDDILRLIELMGSFEKDKNKAWLKAETEDLKEEGWKENRLERRKSEESRKRV